MNEILKKRIEEACRAHYEYRRTHPHGDVKDYAFVYGAEYAISHQWISVDEALPEANENVLALIDGVPVVAKGYHVRARLRDITHWMPIPKLNPDKPE